MRAVLYHPDRDEFEHIRIEALQDPVLVWNGEEFEYSGFQDGAAFYTKLAA